jgi:hypothetical protein
MDSQFKLASTWIGLPPELRLHSCLQLTQVSLLWYLTRFGTPNELTTVSTKKLVYQLIAYYVSRRLTPISYGILLPLQLMIASVNFLMIFVYPLIAYYLSRRFLSSNFYHIVDVPRKKILHTCWPLRPCSFFFPAESSIIWSHLWSFSILLFRTGDSV